MILTTKQQTLLQLLADGDFHSGTELSSILAISRAAIWKHISSLNKFGIEIIALSGKGYRLIRPLELLSDEKIKSYLTPSSLQLLSKLEIHPIISSTNTYLVERAQIKPESGIVCLAELQTSGRGRRGRHWVSPFGCNIYLSLLWQFQQGFASLAGLSLAVGVAIVRALKELGVTGIGLKWPNDIYWQDKKLGGILIEVSGESGGDCQAVIGLGLNLYLHGKETQTITQPWVDLEQILNSTHYSRNELTALLLNHLLPIVASFEDKGLKSYLNEWRSYDCMLNKAVTIYMGDKDYQGIVAGVDENGMLLLKQDAGDIKTFASGEVSFRQS